MVWWSRSSRYESDTETQAIENIAGLVAPEGTLLVLAAVYGPDVLVRPVPPWPLRQNEIDAFATDGLMAVRVELLPAPGRPGEKGWRAEFHRPAASTR